MGTIWAPDLSDYEGPKYRRLSQALRGAITSGELAKGEKLPPVRDLAWRVDMTPGTVARAYTILTDEGVLEAVVGRGTFVADQSAPRSLVPLEVDGAPHNGDTENGPISLMSPVIPDMGQAALIRELLGRVAENPPSGVMHYPNKIAAQPARTSAARWLQDFALGAVDPEEVVLCNGAQNGIMLIMLAALSGVNPVVYTEDLSYPGIRRAAQMLRIKLISVAMDDQGMRADALNEAVQSHGVGLVCTSAEVHNPTCIHMPEDRRRDIVSICRTHGLQIMDDDCYRLDSARAASFRVLAPERTWYVTSISKALTPALRVGFALAPRGRSGELRRAAEHSFFGLATPISDLAAALLVDPRLPEVKDRVLAKFARFLQITLNQLGTHDIAWQQGVPFVWLRLPQGWRASAFCQAAEAAGVPVRPSEDFASREARAPHAVRIALNCAISEARFEGAMQILNDLLTNPTDSIGV